jgi:hypothetical protein
MVIVNRVCPTPILLCKKTVFPHKNLPEMLRAMTGCGVGYQEEKRGRV